jgi:hypothetical protein
MKVYISGPIKGNDNYVDDFSKAESTLRSLGYKTVNPVTLPHATDATYADYMRVDIIAMLDCDRIYLLRGWEQSQGAKLEFEVAAMCGMSVGYER